jgi:hypothetical protein
MKIAAKIIKSPLLSIWEKEGLILATYHDQGQHNLAMPEEVLI